MSRSGDIGTKGANAVCRVLQANGWPYAERRDEEGRNDRGDVAGTIGICWQVKAGEQARVLQKSLIHDWMAATEQQRLNARADLGVLVMARRGYGTARAGHWWAAVPWRLLADLQAGRTSTRYPDYIAPCLLELADLLPILRVAGYGTTPTLQAS